MESIWIPWECEHKGETIIVITSTSGFIFGGFAYKLRT